MLILNAVGLQIRPSGQKLEILVNVDFISICNA